MSFEWYQSPCDNIRNNTTYSARHATKSDMLRHSTLSYSALVSFTFQTSLLFSARPFVYRKFLHQPSFDYPCYTHTKLYCWQLVCQYVWTLLAWHSQFLWSRWASSLPEPADNTMSAKDALVSARTTLITKAKLAENSVRQPVKREDALEI